MGFTVTAVEEEDRRVSFRAPAASFHLTIPEKIGIEEWVTLYPLPINITKSL